MNFISDIIVPSIISIILLYGLIEKKKVFDLFCDGAKDGIKITIKMFPTLIGIFLAIGMLRNSGLLDSCVKILSFITQGTNIPNEIMPLEIIRPISGSASIALATDLMLKYGSDSRIGMIAASIMGSSETTFYVIAIYKNSIGEKKSRNVLIPAILADITSVIKAILILK